ncbi:hypothetical protein FB465_1946 [Kitasatospora atroaurantiaca]|uniref:Helix-turn-helix protein n=2 Tax=Kitasatospora atroaurantiaca TaxID=285545 RepID=A0A561EMU9_9ACTN|nr:hypothetical protein FB465_1946 [Kitasatospora atroaurantiaca]
MKLADSADDQTRIAAPGLVRLMAWSGVGEKTVVSVITELVGLGLVERVKIGRAGQRAEYRIFPLGVPPIPSTEELEQWREEAANAPRNPRLARASGNRSRPAVPARTHLDVQARATNRVAPAAPKPGSEPGSPEGNPASGGSGRRRRQPAGLPQGNPGDSGRVPDGEPEGFPQGDPGGSPRETPVLPVPSLSLPYPPTPAADAAADAAGEPASQPEQQEASGCPKHPSPAANCRGCGTNARAERERNRRALADADRRNDEEWVRAFMRDQRDRRQRIESEPTRVAEALEEAKRVARAARTRANP